VIFRYSLTIVLIVFSSVLFLQYDTKLSSNLQWALITGQNPLLFAEFVFLFSSLPRLAIALMVGATLGLVGSLIQQITRNPLLSPLTLGTSAGAWLALISVSIFLPAINPNTTAMIVMCGSVLSMSLVLLISGLKNLASIQVILAGMAVNILLGAITSALIILRDQYAKNLFLWGAGDLAQNDWQWMIWLAPKLAIALLILFIAPKALQLLRIGQTNAKSLGLPVIPVLCILFVSAMWLMSATITAVGIISFIGLISPNIARFLGAKNAADELYYSTLVGALILLLADFVARIASNISVDIIPTGTATALVGAPVLIYLALRHSHQGDKIQLSQYLSLSSLNSRKWGLVILIFIFSCIAAIFLNHNATSWSWSIPSAFEWQVRSVRVAIALAAGICMAIAGTILQRIIKNPLASPDLLGVSAGASAAIVISSLIAGKTLFVFNPIIALAGSLTILGLLIFLMRKRSLSPATVILLGVALTALVEALIQFVLAKGTQDVFSILAWLAGSTYGTSFEQAATLSIASIILLITSLTFTRSIGLLNLDSKIAQGRGLNTHLHTKLLLALVAISCAIVTATLGPIAFVGLLAPHLACVLGANKVTNQLLLASLLGAIILVLADWLGRNILYPSQVAAGTLAAALGGGYFVVLLLRARFRS
jgi:iron complex transport system permease protein